MDVVSPAHTAHIASNQGQVQPVPSSAPIQPVSSKVVLEHQASFVEQLVHTEPQSQPESYVSIAQEVSAQPVLPRKPRTNPVVRTKISTDPIF